MGIIWLERGEEGREVVQGLDGLDRQREALEAGLDLELLLLLCLATDGDNWLGRGGKGRGGEERGGEGWGGEGMGRRREQR